MKTFRLISVTTALVLASGSALATSSPNLYSLKGSTQAGSNIPAVAAKSTVPFNKSFDNMTAAEQATVRKQFSDLGVNDTPPFPEMGLKSIYSPLIKANKRIRANGRLELTATVNELGEVTDIEVAESPSKAMTRKAKRVLSKTRFDVASCDGTACSMDFPVKVVFN